MVELPDKYREEAKEVAAATHGAARDEGDSRKDAMTAQLLRMFEGMNTEIIGYIKTQALITNNVLANLDKAQTAIDRLMSAFAEDDPIAHREYHELLIKIVRDRSEFWSKMRWHLVEVGIFSFLAWAGYQLWKAFLMGPK